MKKLLLTTILLMLCLAVPCSKLYALCPMPACLRPGATAFLDEEIKAAKEEGRYFTLEIAGVLFAYLEDRKGEKTILCKDLKYQNLSEDAKRQVRAHLYKIFPFCKKIHFFSKSQRYINDISKDLENMKDPNLFNGLNTKRLDWSKTFQEAFACLMPYRNSIDSSLLRKNISYRLVNINDSWDINYVLIDIKKILAELSSQISDCYIKLNSAKDLKNKGSVASLIKNIIDKPALPNQMQADFTQRIVPVDPTGIKRLSEKVEVKIKAMETLNIIDAETAQIYRQLYLGLLKVCKDLPQYKHLKNSLANSRWLHLSNNGSNLIEIDRALGINSHTMKWNDLIRWFPSNYFDAAIIDAPPAQGDRNILKIYSEMLLRSTASQGIIFITDFTIPGERRTSFSKLLADTANYKNITLEVLATNMPTLINPSGGIIFRKKSPAINGNKYDKLINSSA